jgi:hypothetical protein
MHFSYYQHKNECPAGPLSSSLKEDYCNMRKFAVLYTVIISVLRKLPS